MWPRERWQRRTGASGAALLAAGLLALAAPAASPAATFTVTTTQDGDAAAPVNDGLCRSTLPGNPCTLRAAVDEAKGTPGTADVVELPAAATPYALNAASPISILTATEVTIRGAGPAQSIIDGNDATQLFFVQAGGTKLTFDRVTLTDALSADSGSAVFFNSAGGTLTFVDAVVRENRSTSSAKDLSGGAVRVFSGTLVVDRSTFSGNSVVTGGTYNAFGGAIAAGGAATVTNSTFADNGAFRSGTGSAIGGAMFTGAVGPTGYASTTFTGNTATTSATAISAQSEASPVVTDSIVRGSGGGLAPCSFTLSTNLASTGNVDWSGIGGVPCLPADGNVRADPLLGSLALNGGFTPTALPGAGSAAVNATTCAPTAIDQRGNPRPGGATCDAGAAELGADFAVAPVAPFPTTATIGVALTLSYTVLNQGLDTAGGLASISVPAGFRLDSGSCTGGSATVVLCPTPQLKTGETFVLTATVTPVAAGPQTTTARVTGMLEDVFPADNTSTSTTDVAAPVVPGPGPGGPPVLTPAALRVSAFSFTRKRFRVGPARTATVAALTPRGTTITYATSGPSTLTITIERVLPKGRRVGGRCVVLTKANRRRTACSRFPRVGTLRRAAVTTVRRISFSGRIGTRKLAPGTYRATATARTPDGRRAPARTPDGRRAPARTPDGRRAPARTVTFTVVRR